MAGSGRFAALRDKARRGFRGYPVATVAYYGPDASRATKVAVGIILKEGDEPDALERWHSSESDVRFDQEICGAALEFRYHRMPSRGRRRLSGGAEVRGVPILGGSRPMDRKDHSVSGASSNFAVQRPGARAARPGR